MKIISLIINYIVIIVICTEFISIYFGVISADRLLISSTLSGLLTIVSFKLSGKALLRINTTTDLTSANDGKKEKDCL
jgi:hypothetical protein